MRTIMRLVLALALVSFGAVAAAVRPAYADDRIIGCSGRLEPACGSTTSEVCTRVTICGIVWPRGIALCCAEKQTTVEYTYYE